METKKVELTGKINNGNCDAFDWRLIEFERHVP
jgi:hypothetical protein